MMQITKFGFLEKLTGNLINFRISAHLDTGCLDGYTVELMSGSDQSIEIWLVNSADQAEWVRQNRTHWYDAVFDRPYHEFNADELEVVQIVMEIRPVSILIPSQSGK